MCDYVIYAMFVAIGATVWLLWEICATLYNKVQCHKMRKTLLKAYNKGQICIFYKDAHELFLAISAKDTTKLHEVYNRYVYKGKFMYK